MKETAVNLDVCWAISAYQVVNTVCALSPSILEENKEPRHRQTGRLPISAQLATSKLGSEARLSVTA
jgi:hypothetical protein